MKARFLGAAGTVTGSRTLLTSEDTRILVDCGLFQGFKHLRQRNWERLEVDARLIDAVVLTHAHLDHAGFLPILIRLGFAGPVYCTQPTAELLALLLPDFAQTEEEDAAEANRLGYSKHDPALPLFTQAEARSTLERIRGVGWDEEVRIGPMHVTFTRSGHLLGAASVRVAAPSASMLFSGDIGPASDDVLLPAQPAPAADHVLLEATYGDRLHEDGDVLGSLADAVQRTVSRGGCLLIPAFAVGRTQAVLWALHQLREEGRIPDVPLFLDSPMAVEATELYLSHASELRMEPDQLRALHDGVNAVSSAEESKALTTREGPFILVSSSGMLSGGRILHHLAARAGDPANTVLFVNHQAEGSRGAQLLAGDEVVKIHGEEVAVRCEVAALQGFSAHADQRELVGWLRALLRPPRRVFLNHGSPQSIDTLRREIGRQLGWAASAATEGVEWDLGSPTNSPATAPVSLEPVANPAYVRADRDLDFIGRDDMRAVRLMLEYEKVEKALVEHEIGATVVAFGSARIGTSERPMGVEADDWEQWYEVARQFGALVGQAGELAGQRVAVMSGGGGGIMEAVTRGAREAGAPAIGLNINLPWEQRPNPYVTPELCFQFRYFAMRKMHFLRRARALVGFPGGFGTFDEVYEALCLIQVGKMPRIPVVLVGAAFWQEGMPLASLVRRGLISPEDVDLVSMVDDAEEAWATIERFYADGAGQHAGSGSRRGMDGEPPSVCGTAPAELKEPR